MNSVNPWRLKPGATSARAIREAAENAMKKNASRFGVRKEKETPTREEASARHYQNRARYKRMERKLKGVLDGPIMKLYRELNSEKITLDNLRLACEASPTLKGVLQRNDIPRDVLILRLTTLLRKGSFPEILRKGRAVIKRSSNGGKKINVGISDAELIKSPWYKLKRQNGTVPLLEEYAKEHEYLRQLKSVNGKASASTEERINLLRAQCTKNLNEISAVIMKWGTDVDKGRLKAKIKELERTK